MRAVPLGTSSFHMTFTMARILSLAGSARSRQQALHVISNFWHFSTAAGAAGQKEARSDRPGDRVNHTP